MIPITSAIQQTSLLGIIAVGLCVGLRSTGSPSVATLLSLVFLLNYVTGASYTLYSKYVYWQTTLPSVFRIHDFLEATETFNRMDSPGFVRVEGLPSSGNPTPTEPSVRISRTGLFSDRFTE